MASAHLVVEFFYPVIPPRPSRDGDEARSTLTEAGLPLLTQGVFGAWLPSRKQHSQVSPCMRWMIREPIWVGKTTSK